MVLAEGVELKFVESIELNEYGGLLQTTVPFSDGLNILSGENGTGKTTVIRRVKEAATTGLVRVQSDDPAITSAAQLRMFALSPKRNAERQSIEQLVARLRQQNRNFPTFVSEFGARQINDATFDSYASLGEAFHFYYEDATKGGGNQIEGMDAVVREFNAVLTRVFPEYELLATWNEANRAPDVSVRIHSPQPLRLEWLSVGQREVLSLIFNMYATRDVYDVFLIDEPEIHLNWSLERGLFQFFDWFCSEYRKQIIVATHSRIAFESPFLAKTRFLVWEAGKVQCTLTLTNSQRVAIAGEIAASIITAAPQSKTFYVEDRLHCLVVEALSKFRGRPAQTVPCGNSQNVKSLFQFARSQQGWDQHAFFVVDGDGQGNSFPRERHFVHLNRYCIECYLFDLPVVASITGKSIEDLRVELVSVLNDRKAAIFGTGRSAGFGQMLIGKVTGQELTPEVLGTLDCSAIFDQFAALQSLAVDRYIERYVDASASAGTLNEVFDPTLLAAMDE